MEHTIYILINNEIIVNFEVDEVEFQTITANPNDSVPDYVNTRLDWQQIGDVSISSMAFSFDGENFCELCLAVENIPANSPEETAQVEGSQVQTQTPNNSSQESEQNLNQKPEWGEQETRFLLDKYENYLPLVGPMKRFRKKKHLWIAVSADLETVLGITKSPGQCENRYKTVIRRKKSTTEHNRRTGESPKQDPYEEEISKISAIDDTVDPGIRLGVGRCIIGKQSFDNLSSPSPATLASLGQSDINASTTSQDSSQRDLSNSPIRKKRLTDVLLTIAREKEEGRNRRHKEKMEFLKKLSEQLFRDNK